MTETAASIITDALGEILVEAQEQPIEGAEMTRAIRYLNRMMASLDSRGISLGYTVVSGPSDVITVPDGAVDGVIYNLALRLASQYDEPITQSLFDSAKLGMNAMLDIAVTVDATPMPCTMPVGSGNEGDRRGFQNDHFYDCPSDEILNEGGGSIDLESGT